MRSLARSAHLVLAWLFVACLIVQVFLAGLGVFDTSASFEAHRNFGYLLSWATILLAVLALLGGMGRRLALLGAGSFGLFILQSVFVAMRETNPTIAALHPVNGFLILLIAVVMARDSWLARASTAAAS